MGVLMTERSGKHPSVGSAGLAAETDPAAAVVGPNLDVCDLAGRYGDAPAALVGDPQDVGSAGEGGLDGPLDGRALFVIDFHADLARGLGHTDSNVHGEKRTAA